MTTPFTHLVSEKTTQNNTHPNNAGATYSLTCEWVLWSARRGKGVKILRHTPDAQTTRPQSSSLTGLKTPGVMEGGGITLVNSV